MNRKRIGLGVLILLLLAPCVAVAGKPKRSNFIVSADDRAIAQEIANHAEECRRSIALTWLGYELPDWSEPCRVAAKCGDNLGAGGQTSFLFDGTGSVDGLRGDWQGSHRAMLVDVVPHEVLHTVFASHFGHALPRWADEGVACYCESTASLRGRQVALVEHLKSGHGTPTLTLWKAKEYPAAIVPFYSQASSQAAFLVEANGPQGFVAFLETALGKGYESALRTHYEIKDQGEFQGLWLDWVRSGSPPPSKTITVSYNGDQCKRCPCKWYPGKLWQQRPGYIIPNPRRPRPVAQQPASPPQASTAPTYTPPASSTPLINIQPGQPSAPPAAPASDRVNRDLQNRIAALEQAVAALKNASQVPGPPGADGAPGAPGQDGAPGPQGPAGPSGVNADPSAVTASAIAAIKQEPLTVQMWSPDGKVLQEQKVYLGGTLPFKLRPIAQQVKKTP